MAVKSKEQIRIVWHNPTLINHSAVDVHRARWFSYILWQKCFSIDKCFIVHLFRIVILASTIFHAWTSGIFSATRSVNHKVLYSIPQIWIFQWIRYFTRRVSLKVFWILRLVFQKKNDVCVWQPTLLKFHNVDMPHHFSENLFFLISCIMFFNFW